MAIQHNKTIEPKHSTHTKKRVRTFAKSSFWFLFGAILGFFFFTSFIYISYKQTHTNRVYEGVMINGVDVGGKTYDEVLKHFIEKNKKMQRTQFMFTAEEHTATLSAKHLGLGYDAKLLAKQAISIGRSGDILADMSLILQAYTDGITLSPAYHYNDKKLTSVLAPMKKTIDVKPVNALFSFENGKVSAFRLASDGRTIDEEAVKKELAEIIHTIALSENLPPKQITIAVPIIIVEPEIATDKANDKGITELLGEGVSFFRGSIENRAYNINLAASRLNGLLIPPGEVFSFTKAIGDISTKTGFKQAYVIENGKTVLGDGGGVCQVSTTLFRAALNAGLPIEERHQHAYRVGYYEQNAGPGIDAAIYSPNIDFQFKNDTKHSILIQTNLDLAHAELRFQLYGTNDGRAVTITKPVILSESPAPEPLYQDDPTLPKGEVKQVDFAAPGANVFFTRTVTKDGKEIISDKFISNYRPWQAIFLRGTKE